MKLLQVIVGVDQATYDGVFEHDPDTVRALLINRMMELEKDGIHIHSLTVNDLSLPDEKGEPTISDGIKTGQAAAVA